MGGPTEDRVAAEAVFGDVDRYGWLALGLLRCQLSEAAVWSAVGVVVKPFGQYASCVLLVQDEDLVE